MWIQGWYLNQIESNDNLSFANLFELLPFSSSCDVLVSYRSLIIFLKSYILLYNLYILYMMMYFTL